MVYAEGIHADPPEPEGAECQDCYEKVPISEAVEVRHFTGGKATILVCWKCYDARKKKKGSKW